MSEKTLDTDPGLCAVLSGHEALSELSELLNQHHQRLSQELGQTEARLVYHLKQFGVGRVVRPSAAAKDPGVAKDLAVDMQSKDPELDPVDVQVTRTISMKRASNAIRQSERSMSAVSSTRAWKDEATENQVAAKYKQGMKDAMKGFFGEHVQPVKLSAHLRRLQAEIEHKSGFGPTASSLDKLHNFVYGPLDIVMGAIVFANAIVLMCAAEDFGQEANFALGLNRTRFPSPRISPEARDVVECTFLWIYIVELILRLGILRTEWAYSRELGIQYFNVMDGFLVVTCTVDYYTRALLENEGSPNLIVLRLMKLLRVCRVLRIFKAMTIFRPLRTLIGTMVASLGALFWSMVVLFVLKLIAALILCEMLHSYIMDTSKDEDTRLWVNRYYGSFSKAFYTMFEVTYSGGWPNYARRLIEDVSPYYQIFYVSYVTFVIFATIRIITALFLKETLTVAGNDESMNLHNKMKEASKFKERLHELFHIVDVDGSGSITRGEFWTLMSDHTMLQYLSLYNIEVHELEYLFDIIDNGDGRITFDEFCTGITRIRGPATATDVAQMMHDTRVIRQQNRIMMEKLGQDCVIAGSHLGGGVEAAMSRRARGGDAGGGDESPMLAVA